MDNPLKRSFDLNYKKKEDNTEEKIDHENAFDQSDGATSFLKEQSSPFSGDETAEEDEEMDEALASALGKANDQEEESHQPLQEEEGGEIDRGAVEDVLARLNGDYETQQEEEDRVAVEDVLQSLNGSGDGYSLGEGDVPDELEDNQFEKEDEEEEDEMDEVVASVLDELNDEQLNEDEEDPCWDGYTQVGMKTQDGEEVPNCVPDDEVDDAEGYEESIDQSDLMDAVLEDQVQELHRLDNLAAQVLNE